MKIGSSALGKRFGVGYCSTDLHSVVKGEIQRPYSVWHAMLERCYGTRTKKVRPTYERATVSEEWHDYANFHHWFNENYYEIGDLRIELDKDIIQKGNKKYSRETCCFVPSDINVLFTKRDRARGSLPIGVNLHKEGVYRARLMIDGKKTHLGLYEKPEEAFIAYKVAKEAEIKRKATLYKHVLSSVAYEALINYEVHISD